MNFGTKLRTVLFIVSILNQANVALGVWEFGNETVNLVYKIFSYLLTLVSGAAALWFNNDFTPIAAEYTGAMRLEKELQKGEDDGIGIEVDQYIEDGDGDE